MARLGQLEYPELLFTEALQAVDAIKRENVQTKEGLAHTLGHTTAKSGPFTAKLAALSKYYGLIDQSKGDVELTSLGKRLAFPIDENDKRAAEQEALLRVPLIRELFNRLGPTFHRIDFKPKLRDITKADPQELEKRFPRVLNLYSDAARYLSTAPPTNKALEPDSRAISSPEPPPTEPVVSSGGEDYVYQSQGTMVRIPKNLDQLEEVAEMIEVWMKNTRKRMAQAKN